MIAPEKQGLKGAIAALVRAAGGVEAGAEFCRLGKSQLSDAGSINQPDKYLPADAIMDLEAVTHGAAGAPIVTRYLARRAGYELYALPGATAACWHGMLAGLAKEGSDVMAKIAIHAPQGITAAKVRETNLVGEIQDALQVLVNMLAASEAVLKGE